MIHRSFPRARWLSSILLLFVPLVAAVGKDQPQIVLWPNAAKPLIRFAFGKFRSLGNMATDHTYAIDTSAENLSNAPIPIGRFNLYVFDKNKVRIGEGLISLDNLRAGETTKSQTTSSASGMPASLSIVEQGDVPKTVSLTVNSVPQGATLKVDGNPVGSTPKLISVGNGKHILDFSKEGFHSGSFPLDIGRDDTSGGSISYELGASAMDTVEMQDGSVLTGDLVAVTVNEVIVKAGGTEQHLRRSEVKRILLIERATVDPK